MVGWVLIIPRNAGAYPEIFGGGGGVLPLICFSDGVQTQNALCLPFFKLNFLTKRGGGSWTSMDPPLERNK